MRATLNAWVSVAKSPNLFTSDIKMFAVIVSPTKAPAFSRRPLNRRTEALPPQQMNRAIRRLSAATSRDNDEVFSMIQAADRGAELSPMRNTLRNER